MSGFPDDHVQDHDFQNTSQSPQSDNQHSPKNNKIDSTDLSNLIDRPTSPFPQPVSHPQASKPPESPIIKRLDWDPRCLDCGRTNEYGYSRCDPVLPRICHGRESEDDHGNHEVEVGTMVRDEEGRWWYDGVPDFF